MRQIALDTETTGRNTSEGHRILEIGCIELVNRRFSGQHYHSYINPERESEAGALAVHGITSEFLADKPLFAHIIEEFLNFVKGAQLIIHNASFDIGFLDYELKRAGKKYGSITDYCTILDTLPLARQLHVGQRNSLDALCKRYSIDNSHRDLHGALVDADLLARVYLAMTGGQTNLFQETATPSHNSTTAQEVHSKPAVTPVTVPVRILPASANELAIHQEYLTMLAKVSGGKCLWQQLDTENKE